MTGSTAPRPGRRTAVPVFSHILRRGTATRTEIAEVFGISAAAVTRIVRPLLADGLLREREASPAWSGVGRPAQVLEVVAERERFLGVKVNRDQLVAVTTDLRAGVHDTVTVPLPRPGRGRAVPVPAVADGLASALARSDGRISGVGVAVSGDVNRPAGRVELSPILRWEGVELRTALASVSPAPVVIDNDVHAVTAAEQWFGAGVGVDPFVVITLGTGIGCGIVVDGRVLRGAFGVSGELGHVCVDLDGPRCHCGAHGCVEAIAATPPLLAAAGEAAGRRITSPQALLRALDQETGRSRPVRRTVQRAGRAVSAAIATVVNLVGPERVLLSAEGYDADALFGPELRRDLDARMFGRAGAVEIVTRELPFTDWARGAAVVAISESVAHHV